LDDAEILASEEHDLASPVFSLLKLHTLSLIATPVSLLFGASLPNLTNLTITSYHSEEVDEQTLAAQALGFVTENGGPDWLGGFPGPQPHPHQTPSHTSSFLQKHGANLRKITLLSAPDWPPIPFNPPRDLLTLCPMLEELTFTADKRALDDGSLQLDLPATAHPLRTLTLGRPNEELLQCLETALRTNAEPTSPTTLSGRSPIANTRQASLLPNFSLVKFTSVKWLKLVSLRAQSTGTSGGMRQWKAALRRYGIRVVDADNAES